jgi:hypothetical protein
VAVNYLDDLPLVFGSSVVIRVDYKLVRLIVCYIATRMINLTTLEYHDKAAALSRILTFSVV